jgi:glycosyltransferase involved in cell wall biosynthesis
VTSPELSAVVLCYRAGDSIRKVVEPLHELLSNQSLTFELVLVANHWPDEADPTPEVVKAFAAERAHVVVVSKPKGGAMGWDMRSGLDAATGEVIVLIDGDSQNPVDDVLKLYTLMRETGAAVGKGRRVSRDDGLYRRTISTGYNLIFRAIFGWSGHLWDVNGKPKGLAREAYRAMTIRSDDWFADAEIVLEARRLNLQIVELPVVFHRNDERASFVKFGAIWEFVRNMARYRLRGRL